MRKFAKYYDVCSQMALGPCGTLPCQNGAACLDLVTSQGARRYLCVCPEGWTGENCTIKGKLNEGSIDSVQKYTYYNQRLLLIIFSKYTDKFCTQLKGQRLCTITACLGLGTSLLEMGNAIHVVACGCHYDPCSFIPLTESGVDWSGWGAWGACSVSCGDGWMSRHRDCVLVDTGAANSELDCYGRSQEQRACNIQECPCESGAWFCV